MKNLKRISRDGLKSIRGGIICPIAGISTPAICPGSVCPSNPCADLNCIVPAGCAGGGPF
ncbi:bacteriocin-like protein [Chryseobacterium populi]|uniref:bacteriocin-like protein n=1 Tax=Chryseobacterium populi TaxID=1144316 RepID=UPI00030415DE|nr:hypothetical protein [Chryseobacterium populi]